MKKSRWKSRAVLTGLLAIFLVTAAAGSRPARPATPARPVENDQNAGTLSGKTILVDAGHGGSDGGARAKDSGVWEKEINLLLARELKTQLAQEGARVIMTRESDMQYSDNKRTDLSARMQLAVDQGADLLLSIHMNEYRSRRESGPQVFYRAGQAQSRLLAGALQAAMIARLRPQKERAAMAGDYFILSLNLPSVLVECGFLSNAAEEKLLLTEDYRRQVACAIRDGVIEYFSLAEKQISPDFPDNASTE